MKYDPNKQLLDTTVMNREVPKLDAAAANMLAYDRGVLIQSLQEQLRNARRGALWMIFTATVVIYSTLWMGE